MEDKKNNKKRIADFPQATQAVNPKASPLGIDNLKSAVIKKDADRIEYEESNPEGLSEVQYKKMVKDAERAQEALNKNKELFKSIDTNGWDGLDGGQRYVDLAPDSAGRKLTSKEILFCRYYVCTNNIKQSLVLAGYFGNNAEMRIIHRPEVRAFISELTDLRLKQLGYDRNTVIKNLAIIGNQDVSDYVELVRTQRTDKTGNVYTRTDIAVKDLEDINKDYARDEYGEIMKDANGNPVVINSEKTRAIKSIRYNDNGQIVVDFHDKMQALKQLANMLDMESPQKITLNDETKRAETERSILRKLEALTGGNSVVDKVEETINDNDNKPDNDMKEGSTDN